MIKLGKILLLLCLFTACGAKVEEQHFPVYQGMDDLKGKKVATMTGCFQEEILEKEYPEVEVLRIDNPADVVQALLTKRCEAILLDDYMFNYHSQSAKGIVALDEPFITAEMGICFPKSANTELLDQFNTFFRQIKEDGTYDEIYERWMYHAHEAEMPHIPLPENGKPIRVATNSTVPPLVYIKNGKLVGMEVEIINRFASHIGRSVIWSDMNFSAMIPALISGTHDMMAAGINITPQRKESIHFSDPHFLCHTLIGIRQENSVTSESASDEYVPRSFVEKMKFSIQRNIIDEDRYLMILEGLKLTALIALMACLLGTLLGGFICWMRMSRYPLFRHLACLYISLMRGTPVLVLLLIMFYVVFAGTSVDAVMVSVITFGMNFAAYVSEMFRSSINSIDKGQTEAGIAMGFSPTRTFIHIVMPQAFKHVLPVYKGELISLVKMTSIVGYIAVQDLTKVSDIIRSRTFDALFPLIMVAILYFILSWIFATILDFIGKKVG